ncbi:hypothetical protein QUB70_00735 [Microcoleus sp. A003_D6]
MPIPQKVFFLWNGPESPFQNLIKRTFARGLMNSLLLIYPQQCSGFKPILSGNLSDKISVCLTINIKPYC